MRAILVVLSLLVLVGAVSTANARTPAPKTTVIPTTQGPLAFESSDLPRLGVFTPDGRLWLATRPAHGVGTAFWTVDIRSGDVQPAGRTLASLQGPMIVGPDGDVWFGALEPISRALDIGRIDHGHVTLRRVVDYANDEYHFVGLDSGADGNVWFIAEDGAGGDVVGRESVTGAVRLFRVSIGDWEGGGLVAGSGSDLYATISTSDDNELAQIAPNGHVRVIDSNTQFGGFAETVDSAGDVWGWGDEPDDLVGVTPRHVAIPVGGWGLSGTDANHLEGAMTTGADGRAWFTSGDANDVSTAGMNPSIGTVTSAGVVTTWPSRFTNLDGSPIGSEHGFLGDLLSGPDGRLYALGYSPPIPDDFDASRPWHLYAVTIPGLRRAPAAKVRTEGVVRHPGELIAWLRCDGRPGQFCAGKLVVRSGGRILVWAYAVAAGRESGYTLAVPGRQHASFSIRADTLSGSH